MLIRIDRNYDYPDLKRQTPNGDGKWGDLEITYDNVDECDIYVVFNDTEKCDFDLTCATGGRVLIMQEPPYDQKRHFLNYQHDFDLIISHFADTTTKNLRQPGMLPWFVDKDYNFLKSLQISDCAKENKAVWITSNRRGNPGHEPRLVFLDMLLSENHSNIEVFGKGINPIDDKFEALSKAKYTIAIENYRDTDYWTEKIMDAYLSLTMPIYYGCENLENYFPKNSFISIDINKPAVAKDKILDIINSDYFDIHQKEIIEARDRVLDQYQFFPWMTSLIEDGSINLGQSKKHSFYTSPKPSFFGKLKQLLSKKG